MDFFKVRKGQPILASLWNDLVAEIRRRTRITVAAPLTMNQDANGTHIALASVSDAIILAKITGSIAYNDYSAKSLSGAVAEAASPAESDFGEVLADEDDIIARDRAQVGGSSPRPLTGLIIAGKVIGRDGDGKRIVEFASAVQKLRIHEDQLQATFLPNPAGDEDWVDQIEIEEACPEEE